MTGRVIIILFFIPWSGIAQVAPGKYFVAFTNKNNTPYSVSSPLAFLSQRAIDRRAAHGINVTSQDLPVTPAYVDSVIAHGATVLNKSKWLNGVIIQTNDTNVVNSIQALPFVSEIKILRADNSLLKGKFAFTDKFEEITASKIFAAESADDYGPALRQLQMLNGDFLHSQGLTGAGMLIAVLDAGFKGANTIEAFQHLFAGNKVLATHDFVDGDNNVYGHHSHGTTVLSCMAANLPGYMIGTAPDAQYILLRTEDAPTEYIVEEYNWACGAEYADSAGADVFNSSLGYTTFNDTLYNHTYADMDGNTTVVTIAADIAASKGILVVNSAGNTGAGHINAPADGDSVLAVGGVDAQENIYDQSSHGPSYDGRVKPNVCAQGFNTYLAFDNGAFGRGSGTSFASPIIAGMAACLWQAFPALSNMDILHAIEQSADRYQYPDTEFGYGIPDMKLAWLSLGGTAPPSDDVLLNLYPNPFTSSLTLSFYTPLETTSQIEIFDMSGKGIYNNQDIKGRYYHILNIDHPLSKGVYVLRLTTPSRVFYRKIVRQ